MAELPGPRVPLTVVVWCCAPRDVVGTGGPPAWPQSLRPKSTPIAELAEQRDEAGRRLVVRNGYHQPRSVTTVAGTVE
ncbi:hypothetical protein FNV68_00965 [Streptomyces sp. S1D4-23]|nr:hypothetical protein FNV68_00965 [Streptomyces sp. S1D4-23]